MYKIESSVRGFFYFRMSQMGAFQHGGIHVGMLRIRPQREMHPSQIHRLQAETGVRYTRADM